MIRLLTIFVATGLLASCGGSGGGRYAEDYEPDYSSREPIEDDRDERIAELEAQLEEAREQAEELQARQGDLEAASSDLQHNVARLESENWRDVVPDIEQSTYEVDSAQQDAASSAQELSDSLEEQ